MSNIVDFPGGTTLDVPVDGVIQGAADAQLTGVIVLGEREDGEEYFASSYGDRAEMLWLLERFKQTLLTDE